MRPNVHAHLCWNFCTVRILFEKISIDAARMGHAPYLHDFSERLAVAFEQTELCGTCQHACQARCCPFTGYEVQRPRSVMEERLLHQHTVVLQSENQALCSCVCCRCIRVVQILPACCRSLCCCQKPDLQHRKCRCRHMWCRWFELFRPAKPPRTRGRRVCNHKYSS